MVIMSSYCCVIETKLQVCLDDTLKSCKYLICGNIQGGKKALLIFDHSLPLKSHKLL